MRYRQDIENCRADAIGDGGIEAGVLEESLSALADPLERIANASGSERLALIDLPSREDDLAAVRDVAARYRESFTDVLVLGTGGSSLGGMTLAALGTDASAPRLHFLENVDPDGFEATLAACDLSRTGVLFVSKSGTTAETLSQAFALLPRLRDAAGEAALADRITAICDPVPEGKSEPPLRRMAARLGFPVLEHEARIGGRYAALTNVGLIPAAIAGLDPAAIRDGAGEVLDATFGTPHPADAPPALGAALSIGLARTKGATQTVLMPYLDRLRSFAFWYRQLWAESLGKGGNGTTPLDAHGTVDQHSQLQLWLDGPADKLFSLILGEPGGTGPVLDTSFAGGGDDLAYLQGRRLGDLLAAEQQATADSLVRYGRPVRLFRVRHTDGPTMGALMMHFMLETILAASLLGVDPFDQPAVEDGKVLARKTLAALGDKDGT